LSAAVNFKLLFLDVYEAGMERRSIEHNQGFFLPFYFFSRQKMFLEYRWQPGLPDFS
jgi:hypothetical protein